MAAPTNMISVSTKYKSILSNHPFKHPQLRAAPSKVAKAPSLSQVEVNQAKKTIFLPHSTELHLIYKKKYIIKEGYNYDELFKDAKLAR